jgi:hypothetical protein
MGFLLQAAVLLANGESLAAFSRLLSNYDSLTRYFLDVSMRGFVVITGDALRLFIYLLGFYIGLSAAFPDPAVRKQLSEPA